MEKTTSSSYRLFESFGIFLAIFLILLFSSFEEVPHSISSSIVSYADTDVESNPIAHTADYDYNRTLNNNIDGDLDKIEIASSSLSQTVACSKVIDADRSPYSEQQPPSNFWWPEIETDYFNPTTYFSQVDGLSLEFNEFDDGSAHLSGMTTNGSCTVELNIWFINKTPWSEWQAAGGEHKKEGTAGNASNSEDMVFYIIDSQRSTITASGNCISTGVFRVEQRPDPLDPATPNFGAHLGPGGANFDSRIGAMGLSTWGWIVDPSCDDRWIMDLNFLIDRGLNAVDDNFDVDTGTSGIIPGANVLDNDTFGCGQVDPEDVVLTSESTGGVTINPDGTITIAEGTPDGVVVLEYTICAVTNPANCDTATVTITIGPLPPIDAVDDDFTVNTGSNGVLPGINVLDNDTLGGEPVDPADIILTSETTGGVTINPDGTITIAEGTPDGEVVLEYTICALASPANCDTATVTINITPLPLIDAVDDNYAVETGSSGQQPGINVLDNDTLGGEPLDPSDIVLTFEITSNITINPDGTITIAEGTPDGVVVLTYTICQIANPANCDIATVTIVIGPFVIDAVDDNFAVNTGSSGEQPGINVLDNDTLNGIPVDGEDVVLTSESTGGVTINPDGSVTIAEGTPDGTVVLEYTICTAIIPANCDTATVTITIGPPPPPIDAVDDDFAVETGSSGLIPDINVLDNDTLDGLPVDVEDIVLTSETTGGVTINPDGTITITEGTPDGVVILEYTICEVADPESCDTATVTITIGPTPPPIDAVDDDFAVETGSSGLIPDINVLDNDTLDGLPVDAEDIVLTSETTGGVTINPDGTITIAEGTPDGVVILEYTICEVADPESCDTATVTITIGPPPPPIDAVDDDFAVETGSSGLIPDINVLDNDTLDGLPVDAEDIVLTSETTGGVTINPDGTITIAEGTPDGVVILEYTICEVADPESCDTATVTITIGPLPPDKEIDAVDDDFSDNFVDGEIGGIVPISNVLDNDTLDGISVSLSDVTITSEPSGPLTVNPDGTVSVAPGTASGTYTISYTICEIENPENCDTAFVTVRVVGPIEVNQLVTPNGDGKNDFLFIRNVDRTLTNTLRIYNRWGVSVYVGADYNNQNNVFDGRSRARSTLSVNDYLPAGVYYYIFDYQTEQEKVTDSGYLYISK